MGRRETGGTEKSREVDESPVAPYAGIQVLPATPVCMRRLWWSHNCSYLLSSRLALGMGRAFLRREEEAFFEVESIGAVGDARRAVFSWEMPCGPCSASEGGDIVGRLGVGHGEGYECVFRV